MSRQAVQLAKPQPLRRSGAPSRSSTAPYGRLEMEAEQAAARGRKGERNLARQLSRATPASRRVAGSSGQPLPPGLRAKFERAYGADFTEVRVHRDGAAARAAGELNAYAFTSGERIYFARDGFSEHNLAHELAHTIQQGGREQPSGVFQVTPVSGSGPVQLLPKNEIPSNTSPVPGWKEIVARHQAAHPADARFQTESKKQLDQWTNAVAEGRGPDYWNALSAVALVLPQASAKLDRNLWAMFYDGLKIMEKYDACVAILKLLPDLSSTYFTNLILPRLELDSFSVFLLIGTLDPFFKPYASRFWESVVDTLVRPTGDIQNLGVQKALEVAAKEELDKRLATTGLMKNDVFFLMVWALLEADRYRQEMLYDAKYAVAGQIPFTQLTPQQRGEIAKRVSEAATALGSPAGRAGKEPAALRIFDDYRVSIMKAASFAADFWKLSFAFSDLLVAGAGAIEGIGTIQEIAERGNQSSQFQKFAANLHTPLDAMLALDSDGFPVDTETYDKARLALIAEIRKQTQVQLEPAITLEMHNWLKQGAPVSAGEKPSPPPDLKLLVFLGSLVREMWDLIAMLDTFHPDEDRKFGQDNKLPVEHEGASKDDPTIVEDKPAPDFRVDHRQKVASMLWKITSYYLMPEIRKSTDDVLTMKQAGVKRSFVALLSEWALDSNSKYPDLLGDFSPTFPIETYDPFRSTDLVWFFDLITNQNLIKEFSGALKGAKKGYDVNAQPLSTQARLAAENFLKPTRYVVERFNIAIRKEDVEKYDELLLHHPVTERFIATKLVDGHPPLHIVPRDVTKPLLWIIPPLDALVARLRGIEFFETLVEYALIDMGGPPKQKLSDKVWWNILVPQLSEISEKGASPLQAVTEFRAGLLEERNLKGIEAARLERQVAIIDRTEHVERRLKPLLDEFDEDDPIDSFEAPEKTGLKGDIVNASVPDMIAWEVQWLPTHLLPRSERPLHMAMMALELAEEDYLGKLIGMTSSWQLTSAMTWEPLLDSIIAIIDAQDRNLERVMTKDELKQSDFIATRRDYLNTIRNALRATRETAEKEMQSEFGFRGFTNKDGKQTLTAVGHGYEITTEEEPFEIAEPGFGSFQWKIEAVLANFEYHPKVGQTPASLFFEDADGELIPATDAQKQQPLVRVAMGTRTGLTLSFQNELELGRLNFAITMHALVVQLEQLGEMLKEGVEITMDLIEMFPGMQWMMGVRMFLAAVQFIASPEFETFKQEVAQNPMKLIEKAKDLFLNLVSDSGLLWEYLLFGNSAFNALHGATGKAPASKLAKGGVGARIVALLEKVYNFGKELLGSASRLQTQVRWKVEGVELFVLQHPLLATVMRYAAVYFDNLIEIAGNVSDSEKAILGKVSAALKSWPDTVIHLVELLEKPDLPKEIVPLGDVVEAIVELVLSRMSLKYRLAGGIILLLLEKADKKKPLFDAIAAGLHDVDPNRLWYDETDPNKGMRAELQSLMRSAGYELAVKLFDTLSADNGLPEFILNQENRGLFRAKRDEAQAAKSATPASPAGWGAADTPVTAGLPQTAGAPLAPHQARAAAHTFGQDFSHVRVHHDSPSARYTAGVGAAAVTQGSHIFWNPAVAMSGSAGGHVLGHELAHVTQQTGPRPLGQPHSPAPTPIAPSARLVSIPRSNRAPMPRSPETRPPNPPAARVALNRSRWRPSRNASF